MWLGGNLIRMSLKDKWWMVWEPSVKGRMKLECRQGPGMKVGEVAGQMFLSKPMAGRKC